MIYIIVDPETENVETTNIPQIAIVNILESVFFEDPIKSLELWKNTGALLRKLRKRAEALAAGEAT